MIKLTHLRRLVHWGPILALTVIGVISVMCITCAMQWWPPHYIGGFINLTIFILLNVGVLYNFFNAAFIGPGYVPHGWQPHLIADLKHLQYCSVCNGFKSPRAHHCRKCNRCVMKMDHHCPWINNCVGHMNHASFTYFLFYAPCGCIHAIAIIVPTMYRALNMHYYIYYDSEDIPLVTLGMNQFVMCMFAVGLAVGVVIAVGGLFYIQMKSILKNETGIESWIIEKALYRERAPEEGKFIYPYDLGRKENFNMVFSWKPDAQMDGTWYPIADGCHQYTLTDEQIKQKREKQDRSVEYEIREDYSGAIFPCSKGLKICCCPPITDEPRIKLSKGNRVLVSRWKKRWLYGDKLLCASENVDGYRIRGWFPRRCAVEVINDPPTHEVQENKPQTEKKVD